MSFLRMVYLALAVVGVIMPMRYFLQWFNANGFDLALMIEAWHINAATSGLVWDLTIAAITLNIWMLAEVYVRKDYWVAVVCILATWCVGVSFGLPLYLFLRTRRTI